MHKKLFLIGLLIIGCEKNSETDKNYDSSQKKIPNDIRWVTKSSEYDILCQQIYKNAWDNLSKILQKSGSNSCIVMDLDETVLDNSQYQIDLFANNDSYNPESWSKWVDLKQAKLVPGAKKFIDNVRETDVNIIFLSNRMAKNQEPTIKNMKDLEILHSNDMFLLRIDKEDKKHIRREEIINGAGRMSQKGPLKVLAYFGDARHDFPDPNDYFIFGHNMYMFPNPMYGKW